MSIHLSRDLESIHKDILDMCGQVENLVHQAVNGLSSPAPNLALELSELDREIDRFDVRIEESCLKTLALHHPVAVDLRRIASVLKITAELERVADLGVNLAERAQGICDFPQVGVPDKLHDMAGIALDMLHRSIDCYVALDSKAAREVLADDDKVDALCVAMIQDLSAQMQKSPELVDPLLHLFSATRHVERMADHATNIAEDIVYMVEGEIIRHQPWLEQRHSDGSADDTDHRG